MSGYNFPKILHFFCLEIVITFTNSVDPDEMQHYAAFHMGHYCFRKYSFRGLQYTKDEAKIHIRIYPTFKLDILRIVLILSYSLWHFCMNNICALLRVC